MILVRCRTGQASRQTNQHAPTHATFSGCDDPPQRTAFESQHMAPSSIFRRVADLSVDTRSQQRVGREDLPSHPTQYHERHATAQATNAPPAPQSQMHFARCTPFNRMSQWDWHTHRDMVEPELARAAMQAPWQPSDLSAIVRNSCEAVYMPVVTRATAALAPSPLPRRSEIANVQSAALPDRDAPQPDRNAPLCASQQCGAAALRPAAVAASSSSGSLLAMLEDFDHDCDVDNVADNTLPATMLDSDGALDICADDACLQRNVALALSSADVKALQVPQAREGRVAAAMQDDAAVAADADECAAEASDDDDAVDGDEWRPELASEEALAVSGRKRRKVGATQASESRQSRRCAPVALLMLMDTLMRGHCTYACPCC